MGCNDKKCGDDDCDTCHVPGAPDCAPPYGTGYNHGYYVPAGTPALGQAAAYTPAGGAIEIVKPTKPPITLTAKTTDGWGLQAQVSGLEGLAEMLKSRDGKRCVSEVFVHRTSRHAYVCDMFNCNPNAKALIWHDPHTMDSLHSVCRVHYRITPIFFEGAWWAYFSGVFKGKDLLGTPVAEPRCIRLDNVTVNTFAVVPPDPADVQLELFGLHYRSAGEGNTDVYESFPSTSNLMATQITPERCECRPLYGFAAAGQGFLLKIDPNAAILLGSVSFDVTYIWVWPKVEQRLEYCLPKAGLHTRLSTEKKQLIEQITSFNVLPI